MNPFPILLADLRSMRFSAVFIVILIGVAVAIGVAVGAQERALRQASSRAAADFPLLVGAPSSQTPRPSAHAKTAKTTAKIKRSLGWKSFAVSKKKPERMFGVAAKSWTRMKARNTTCVSHPLKGVRKCKFGVTLARFTEPKRGCVLPM